MSSETKNCQSCKNQFVIDEEDFGFYEKMKVPPPTWCPGCRRLRRLAWTGYRILYKKKCDFTGDEVISFYHPSSPHKTYRQDVWWSDKWDPKSYGRDYDFSKPFFEQYFALFKEIPHPTLFTEYTTMVNSEYCNGAAELKDCYLSFKSDTSEKCAYTNTMQKMKDCLDLAYSGLSELSYEITRVTKGYQVFFSQDCDDCHDIYFSRDLVGCSHCIGCINLRNKNYCILNEQYTKEEYEQKLKEFDFGSAKSVSEFKKKVKDFALQYPRRAFHGRKNVDIAGDYIFNSKNVHDSYMMEHAENIRYSELLKLGPSKDSYDYTMFGRDAELIYESAWVGILTNNIKFSFWCYRSRNLEYSFGCHGSGNLFGCFGIRKGEYCILNKQYTKEKYEELVPKIKKQMMDMPYKDAMGREYRYGEFFPSEFCPWAYNESHAYEFFPFAKEEAIAKGFRWSDADPKEYRDATMEVPDNIKDVKDDILKAILKCIDCGKNYQIIKMELDFLRSRNFPIPRQCPLCRDRARIKLLNPMAIYKRTCAKCAKAIDTSYAPERPEIVYCEECYQQEVV